MSLHCAPFESPRQEHHKTRPNNNHMEDLQEDIKQPTMGEELGCRGPGRQPPKEMA